MPSNNSKYTQEIREKTARYVPDNKKSATSVAEETGLKRHYYTEIFYNRKRLHSSLGYMSPVAYRMKEMRPEGA